MRSPLTPARRARLEKLAAYLESLPEDYEHFRMDEYFALEAQDPEWEIESRYARHNGGFDCGTVACAAGHGPAAGILVPPRFVGEGVDWTGYAAALFIGTGPFTPAYSWCFAADWTYSDGHHWGAAARIRYLLDKGKPPPYYDVGAASQAYVKHYAPYRIGAEAQADA